MKTLPLLGMAIIAAMAGATASAQQIMKYRADGGDDIEQSISVVGVDPVSAGAVVTDAPYTAEAVTEVTQTLADGNRIERQTRTTLARSSTGATRREQQGFALGPFVSQDAQPIVTISDPRSGLVTTLNYELKVAFRMKPGWVAMAGTPADKVMFGSPAMASRGAVIMSQRPEPGRERRPMPPPPPPGGGVFEEPVIAFEPFASTAVAAKMNSDYKTEQLEPRTIEGLRAEGTRTTVTIPAGAIGNALPIEVISERWYSPELQIVLMTRRSDPRVGETIYRLTNIVRGEPSADLFRIPADFRIEDPKP